MIKIIDKVRTHIESQPPHTKIRTRIIWEDVFGCDVDRSSITRAMALLQEEGLVAKSAFMKGRSSYWIRIKER